MIDLLVGSLKCKPCGSKKKTTFDFIHFSIPLWSKVVGIWKYGKGGRFTASDPFPVSLLVAPVIRFLLPGVLSELQVCLA